MSSDALKRRAAYHEAGHAVALAHRGYAIGEMRIHPRKGHRLEWDGHVDTDAGAEVVDVLLAGLAAERVLRLKDDPKAEPWTPHRLVDDWAQAAVMIGRSQALDEMRPHELDSDPDTRAERSRVWKEMIDESEAHWSEIEGVATKLLSAESIAPEAAATLVGSVTGTEPAAFATSGRPIPDTG